MNARRDARMLAQIFAQVGAALVRDEAGTAQVISKGDRPKGMLGAGATARRPFSPRKEAAP